MLNKIKTGTEILAILAAGIFALMTWGIDQVEKRKPSWDITIKNTTGLRLQYIDKTNDLESCHDWRDCDTVACKFSARLQIENKGKRPLDLKNTDVDAFFVEKQNMPTAGINGDISGRNLTPRSLLSQVCSPQEEFNDCELTPDVQISVKELDSSPLFPTNFAWRPFTFEIIRENRNDAEAFFQSHGLLIRVRQKITSTHPYYFWRTTEHISSALHYNNAPCSFGIEPDLEQVNNEKTNKISLQMSVDGSGKIIAGSFLQQPFTSNGFEVIAAVN